MVGGRVLVRRSVVGVGVGVGCVVEDQPLDIGRLVADRHEVAQPPGGDGVGAAPGVGVDGGLDRATNLGEQGQGAPRRKVGPS